MKAFTDMVVLDLFGRLQGDIRCATKIPALLARKPQGGGILETEAQFAAIEAYNNLSLDACLNV